MPAHLEKSAVATGLEKVSFHSNSKESNAKEFSNYRTMALILHASKVMLNFLQARSLSSSAPLLCFLYCWKLFVSFSVAHRPHQDSGRACPSCPGLHSLPAPGTGPAQSRCSANTSQLRNQNPKFVWKEASALDDNVCHNS